VKLAPKKKLLTFGDSQDRKKRGKLAANFLWGKEKGSESPWVIAVPGEILAVPQPTLHTHSLLSKTGNPGESDVPSDPPYTEWNKAEMDKRKERKTIIPGQYSRKDRNQFEDEEKKKTRRFELNLYTIYFKGASQPKGGSQRGDSHARTNWKQTARPGKGAHLKRGETVTLSGDYLNVELIRRVTVCRNDRLQVD